MGVLDLMGHVQQQGQAGRERGQQTRLGQLAGMAYGAPQEQRGGILAQMAQINPQAAQTQQTQFRTGDSDRVAQLSQKAKLFVGMAKAGNQQAVAGMYPELAKEARELFGTDIPESYDPSFLSGIEQFANIGMDDASTPAGVREFNGLTQGLSAQDVMAARRVKLGLDGRASSSGFSQVKFTGADGRERIGVLNGQTGQIDLPDGTSFNPNTGQVEQTRSAQQAPQAGMYQTPQGIARIGDDLSPEQREAAMADMAQGGQASSVQLPQRNVLPAQRSSAAFVSRSPEEQAALTEQAKTGVELANLPQRGQIEAQNAAIKEAATQAAGLPFAGQKKAAELTVERQQKAMSDLPRVEQNANQMIGVLDKLLSHPGKSRATGLGSLNPLNKVPGTPGFNFGVVMDQLRGKAFLQAFETLKGGGQITEVEGKKATDAIGRLNTAQSEGEFDEALRELRGIVQDALTRAQQQALGGNRPAQRQIKRTGTINGRKVIQYTDGTTSYAD